MPTDLIVDKWKYETKLRAEGFLVIAGADEAGRGPLAGPVVAGAVTLPFGCELQGINDSKKLTHKSREKLFDYIYEIAEGVGIGIADPQEIDEINILQASMLAMKRAIENLPVQPAAVLVDGNQRIKNFEIPQYTIIQGDYLSASIAAASIIAKVTRDRMMIKYHDEYPEYGFDKHKGYPCKDHMDKLKQFGACPIHRRSYAPVAEVAGGGQCRLPGL